MQVDDFEDLAADRLFGVGIGGNLVNTACIGSGQYGRITDMAHALKEAVMRGERK
ncbi:MAG: hypothetical protein NT061_05015 [Spirochaetes bacterium]|nr:hypothetical protein [Spirochaetota bacterium]